MRLIRERSKDAFGLNLLKKTRQVLNVIKPSKCVWKLDLLKVGQRAKVSCNMRENYYISNSDIEPTQEHTCLSDVAINHLGQFDRG